MSSAPTPLFSESQTFSPVLVRLVFFSFALLFAYLALGALALRAKTRESALLALILALTCMGLLFGVALTRDPFMGPWN